MSPDTAADPKTLSVTQLNKLIHETLEGSFSSVWVEGEISGPRAYPSGHTYFTLKDADSQLSAVLFKGVAAGVRFKLEQGLIVLARGRVTTYMKRGQYQLIVSELRPKSAGALQLAFEQLKAKLESQGLFAEERKKPLPPFPACVGIITSSAGAALHDMLNVLGRRFPGAQVRFIPVQVQGDAAAPQIAAAVRDFNEHYPDTDVLLVGRGGGSLEDLWAFNEEEVALAIAASTIPVVSCVGHETDFTIADFVADRRAPTPSAAAELVVPDQEAVRSRVDSLAGRLVSSLKGAAQGLEDKLASLTRSPFLKDPLRIVEAKAQRVDELTGRLLRDPRRLFGPLEDRTLAAAARLAPALSRRLSDADKDLRRLMEQLDALSPLRVLTRGYSIVFKRDGKRTAAARSAAELNTFDSIRIRFHDGEKDARVE